MSELKTEPGWKPPRRGPSDRLLIALLSAVVALLEGWRALVPNAQAAPPDAELGRRIEKLEAGQGKVESWIGDLRVDMADVKARLPPRK